MLIPMSLGQQTAAVRALFARGARAMSRTGSRKRVPRAPRRKTASKRARRAAPTMKARMVKGSKAAKAYMARIRKMRRK